jgi:sugar phosphate isomerase/epimerase
MRVLQRRQFVKTASAALAVGSLLPRARAGELADGAPNAAKIGWRLGVQAYSFNRFTFEESLQKSGAMGLKVIEAYPGQQLSKANETRVGEGMSAAERDAMRKLLDDHGIQLVNYGCCGLPNDESASRKVFEFAKEMGIETLVSEPPFEAFDLLDKLCGEYEINLAIHNHPKPSRYWNYETVLEMCKDRSPRVGACCDTGHWARSGISGVEALKALEGRIISFHFGDLNEFGRRDAHDVPWGTGKCDTDGMLAEVYRQKIEAVFSIEYEHNWLNNAPEMAECVKYFDKVAARLASS